MPALVSFPKRNISACRFRLFGGQALRLQLLKVCKSILYYGTIGVSSLLRQSGSIPWAAVINTGAPEEGIISFLGDSSELEQDNRKAPRLCSQPVFIESSFVVHYVCDKPDS